MTEHPKDSIDSAVALHCSHTGPVDPATPEGCRECATIADAVRTALRRDAERKDTPMTERTIAEISAELDRAEQQCNWATDYAFLAAVKFAETTEELEKVRHQLAIREAAAAQAVRVRDESDARLAALRSELEAAYTNRHEPSPSSDPVALEADRRGRPAKKFLFLGGPLHGERREVPGNQRTVVHEETVVRPRISGDDSAPAGGTVGHVYTLFHVAGSAANERVYALNQELVARWCESESLRLQEEQQGSEGS